MNRQQAAALLGVAAAFDNRKPDADAAAAWAIALEGYRFEDCRDAIVAHYRATNDWLMPNKVITEVKRIRAKRIADYGDLTPPAHIDPDDTLALSQWMKAATRDVADGNPPPRPTPVAGIAPPKFRKELLALRAKADRGERDGTPAAAQAATQETPRTTTEENA